MPYAFTHPTHTPQPQFRPAPTPAPWPMPQPPSETLWRRALGALMGSLVVGIPVALLVGMSWLLLNFPVAGGG